MLYIFFSNLKIYHVSVHSWFATLVDSNELGPVYPFQLKPLNIKILMIRGPLGPQWISWQIFVSYSYSVEKIWVTYEHIVVTGGSWVTHQCIKKPKSDHHILRKVLINYWLILDQGKRFEVICTLDLKMVTWKPISIEAIKVFIKCMNPLCTANAKIFSKTYVTWYT